ncbi:guanine nucleotide exchange factor MSS4 homolog [Sabethes cyaneus]|uniref:guanine nucleotide exchange factor MSS4 homolog n=1 Tax=Sabethes cyaneus TaxID=53552 RepID=UPI00237E38BE|nr:guanine nucleotide exchange factor MSS4 homolog [Sabethes cyaneus]
MSANDEFNPDSLIAEGKNKTNVKCSHCDSLMLKPDTADYVENEFELPEPYQKKRQQGVDVSEFVCKKFKDFWVVADMFTFENIGFSHTHCSVLSTRRTREVCCCFYDHQNVRRFPFKFHANDLQNATKLNVRYCNN